MIIYRRNHDCTPRTPPSSIVFIIAYQFSVMHPFFQGQHYVEAVKKCKFHFLRVLYAAHSSFMQQTPETIFHIRKASCSLMMSEDNPRCIPFAICSELSRSRRQDQTPSAKPDLL